MNPVTAAREPEVHASHQPHGSTLGLAIGALGVVYGDIGTSPLYAIKECINPPHGVEPSTANVLGLLSLVFWSITLVIVIKYLWFVMRADNNGEGGILSLLALVMGDEKSKRRPIVLVLFGLFGAALLYGDGMITPAISVLSAVEGLEVATTAFTPYVVPITCGILIALFLVQRHGTHSMATLFGPATFLWFLAIAAAGIPHLVAHPSVLLAVNPVHAVRFFIDNEMHGFLVLGSVFLVVTGGEALYADMGHFGRRPIRLAWFAMVMPALLLNYFGQGAMLIANQSDKVKLLKLAKNPFYALVQGPWLYPMVVIGTIAAVVASQALISGAFSLTRQAVQLGYFPRVTITHTSKTAEGQIYVPEINYMLMVACVALVLGFQKSTNLAAAYGIAVTGTMAITSMLFFVVTHDRWRWNTFASVGLVSLFLIIDLAFFGANAAKIAHGGWFPLAVGAAIFAIMTTWKRGRAMLYERIQSATLPLDLFMEDIARSKPVRVPGTAVFLTSNPGGTPGVLLHHVKHNKVLHEQVVLLSILTDRVPDVPADRRVVVTTLDNGFWTIVARYGFMQTPNVPDVLKCSREKGFDFKENDTSYYLGRETLIAGKGKGLARWRKLLFGFLSRNARPATAYFSIPPNRVVELGAQIEL